MNNNEILFLDFQPDADRRHTLAKVLEEASFTVITIASHEISAHGEFHPVMLLCRMNGHESFELHKETFSKIDPCPKVILTSEHNHEFYLKGIEAGFFEYILLPCSTSYLVSKIQEILDVPDKRNCSDENVMLTLNEGTHRLQIHSDAFVGSFMSFIDNAIEQNSLLKTLLHNRHALIGMVKEADVIMEEEGDFSSEEMLAMDFSRAVGRGEFELYYQPIVSLKTDELSGFEALIRWNHPEKGFLTPDHFLEAMEESPHIIPLGFWIVEKVAQQLCFLATVPAAQNVRITVNLSARQFVNQELADRIINIAESYGIDPRLLGFEITESAFMDDMELANVNLLKLKSKRFPIYMDDFGTGYSSLSYLLHFPVDVLKIDKSFVQWIEIDEQSEEIVRSVITLAHNLKREVVAEGVQDKEHIEKLKMFGCDYVQGFYIAKPMKAEDVERFIVSHGTGTSTA